MAQLALCGGGRMVLRFASRDVTVVAGPATAKHLGVVHSANRRPARQGVAVLALRGGPYVIGWRCRCLYEAAEIVATGTRPWRALENALDMATFAIDISMCAV